MSRYIDADLLKAGLVMSDKTGKIKCADMRKVLESVDDVPTADVVEVVRCRECRYRRAIENGNKEDGIKVYYSCYCLEGMAGEGEEGANNYCSYGVMENER